MYDVPTIQDLVGRRLRRRRRLLGMTQVALAEACETSFQQIQKYETGAIGMPAARLWRIACALGVPVTYFYDGLAPERPAYPASAHPYDCDVEKAFGSLTPSEQRALLGLADSIAARI